MQTAILPSIDGERFAFKLPTGFQWLDDKINIIVVCKTVTRFNLN